MTLRIAVLGAVLLTGWALADDEASRAKLIGSWQLADGGKEAIVWTFADKGNEVLHITNSSGGRALAEFDCDSFGHECNIKVAGKPAKVSWWYLGPKLVEMETRGSYVWKRTFVISGDGDSMDLEQTQIAPAPKVETQHYKRMPAAGASH